MVVPQGEADGAFAFLGQQQGAAVAQVPSLPAVDLRRPLDPVVVAVLAHEGAVERGYAVDDLGQSHLPDGAPAVAEGADLAPGAGAPLGGEPGVVVVQAVPEADREHRLHVVEEDDGPRVLVGAGDVERVLAREVVVGEDGGLGPLGEVQGLGGQRLDGHRPLLGTGVRVVDDLAAELRPARADRQRARGDGGVALLADEAGEQIGGRVERVAGRVNV
ncbi:hypothetical protein SALBM135S_05521 [Streptomyces alboniger]